MNRNEDNYSGLRLLTVDEVMELLRLSRDTVYRLATSGELPNRKIGRAWRFPTDAVEAYAREGQVRSPRQGGDDDS